MKTTIDMAREAGFNVKMFKPPVITAQHSNGSWVSVGDELKAFEALVRADERSVEREACAKVCDEMEEKAEQHGTECCKWPTPSDCAYAIRNKENT